MIPPVPYNTQIESSATPPSTCTIVRKIDSPISNSSFPKDPTMKIPDLGMDPVNLLIYILGGLGCVVSLLAFVFRFAAEGHQLGMVTLAIPVLWQEQLQSNNIYI